MSEVILLTFPRSRHTPLHKVKVVIVGQDPYHNHNQAHGLAFSVRPPTPAPPSLVNIYKGIKNDYPYFQAPPNKGGLLTPWAERGVLLLNTCLTVRAHQANSHSGKGWERFTQKAIDIVARVRRNGVVFLAWGTPAGKRVSGINKEKHCVLQSVHPSPLSASRGFVSRRLPFRQYGKYPICYVYFRCLLTKPYSLPAVISKNAMTGSLNDTGLERSLIGACRQRARTPCRLKRIHLHRTLLLFNVRSRNLMQPKPLRQLLMNLKVMISMSWKPLLQQKRLKRRGLKLKLRQNKPGICKLMILTTPVFPPPCYSFGWENHELLVYIRHPEYGVHYDSIREEL